MRERIESKHVTKEIKSQMPVIPVEIVKKEVVRSARIIWAIMRNSHAV